MDKRIPIIVCAVAVAVVAAAFLLKQQGPGSPGTSTLGGGLMPPVEGGTQPDSEPPSEQELIELVPASASVVVFMDFDELRAYSSEGLESLASMGLSGGGELDMKTSEALSITDGDSGVLVMSGDFDESVFSPQAKAAARKETHRGVNLYVIDFQGTESAVGVVPGRMMLSGDPWLAREIIDNMESNPSPFTEVPEIAQVRAELGEYPVYILGRSAGDVMLDLTLGETVSVADAVAIGMGETQKAVILFATESMAESAAAELLEAKESALADLYSGENLSQFISIIRGVSVANEGRFVTVESSASIEEITYMVIAWQMGVFNPSGAAAPGLSGFGVVRPTYWECANGTVRAQWVNGAGTRIRVTPPVGGCVYQEDERMRAFEVEANGLFTCEHGGLDGCEGVPAGERFEVGLTLSWEPAGGGIKHRESGTLWGEVLG